MAEIYKKPELSEGIDVALKRLVSICKRDGFELRQANILVYDEVGGAFKSVSYFKGEWHELAEVGEDD